MSRRTGSSRYSLSSEQILVVENGLKQVQPHLRADTCRRERAQAGTASPQSRYWPSRTGSTRYSLTSEQILAVENGLKQVQPHIRAYTCRRERAQAGDSLIPEQILAVENGLKKVQPHIRADTCRIETGLKQIKPTSEQILSVENSSRRYSPHIRAVTCRGEQAQAGTAHVKL